MLTDDIKRELVDRINAAEKIDKILLFGSAATGKSGPDSDIDLIVVLDRDTMPSSYRERRQIIYGSAGQFGHLKNNTPLTCLSIRGLNLKRSRATAVYLFAGFFAKESNYYESSDC